MKYLDARDKCESEGASLAIPKSIEENSFLSEILMDSFWIGVDTIHTRYSAFDGAYVSYTNWNIGEPKQYGVIINWKQKTKWKAASIDELHPFLCIYKLHG